MYDIFVKYALAFTPIDVCSKLAHCGFTFYVSPLNLHGFDRQSMFYCLATKEILARS